MKVFKESAPSCRRHVRTRFAFAVVFVGYLICSMLNAASVYAQAGTAGKDVSRDSTNQGDTATLWNDAAKHPTVSTEELGLSHPKTLFVPGRYTQSGLGAVFFNGKKVVLQNVKTDMVGVLPSGGGLIVANFERNGQTTRIVASKSASISAILTPEEIAKLSPEQKLRLIEAQAKMSTADGSENQALVTAKGNRVVFYFVDSNGSVSPPFHAIESNSLGAVLTDSAIYVASPTAKWRDTIQLYSYTGVNSLKQVLNGPQDVSFATPAEGGQAWFVTKPISGESPSLVFSNYSYGIYRWHPTGALEELRKVSQRYTTLDRYINTTGAFVDSPNTSDSFRSGYVMLAYGVTTSSNTDANFDFSITPNSFTDPLPTRTQIDCFGLCNRTVSLIGQHPIRASTSGRSIEAAMNAAVESAARAVLMKGKSAVLLGSQEDGKSGLNFDLVSLPSRDTKIGFNVMGGGTNLIRSLVGSNSNPISLHKKNDVFAIFTTKGTVLVHVDSIVNSGVNALHVESGRLVNPVDMTDFLNRYGFDAR